MYYVLHVEQHCYSSSMQTEASTMTAVVAVAVAAAAAPTNAALLYYVLYIGIHNIWCIYSGTEFLSYLSWKCYEYHESSASFRHVNFFLSLLLVRSLLCVHLYMCMCESVSVCWSCCLLLMLLVEFLLLLSFAPSIVTSSYTTRGTLYKTSLLQAANPHTNPLSSALPLFSQTHLVAGANDHFYTHTYKSQVQ